MKNKFELGIEVSENVVKTAIPHTIKRYDVVPKKVTKVKIPEYGVFYRYRPGVNSSMTRDLDV